MKRIWLVRHGESKVQINESADHINAELSDWGIEKARRLRKRLENAKPDCIFIGPLRRAWQTYELSRTTANWSEFDSRLIELNWGSPQVYEKIVPIPTPDIAVPDRPDAWLHSQEFKRTHPTPATLIPHTSHSQLAGVTILLVLLWWAGQSSINKKYLYPFELRSISIPLS